MTPLAHRIAKELTLPVKERTFSDHGGLSRRMDDVHCFEVTEVLPLIDELASRHFHENFDERMAFLPAPKTWIEFSRDGMRTAALLQEIDGGVEVRVACLDRETGAFSSFNERLNIILPSFTILSHNLEWASAISTTLYGALVVINTPRLIGRKQYMPHRGLERSLANAKGLVGKFPLHAWTELKLSVSAMMKQADGTVHEAHYTGEKCLHFCRAHIRVKAGRLEMVRAHWRGNPALGIKQTRYKITA